METTQLSATKTKAQERLDRALTLAKSDYDEAVSKAKEFFRFEMADDAKAAKMIKALLDGDRRAVRRAEHLYSFRDRKKGVARALVGKAIIVKARIVEGMYLSFSGRTSAVHYKIEFEVYKDLTISHSVDYSSRPTEEVVLEVAKQYFDSVRRIDLRGK